MRTLEAVRRTGIAIAADRTVRDAAVLMDTTGVGALAVVDADRLVGIVTDRDIVRRSVARGFDLDARIDAIMSTPVVAIGADADLHDALALFRTNAIRRLPVIDDERFVGMLTVDDLLMDVAADLADLTRPVTAETLFGHRDAPVPAVT